MEEKLQEEQAIKYLENKLGNKPRKRWLYLISAVLLAVFLFFTFKSGANFQIFGDESLFARTMSFFGMSRAEEKKTVDVVVFGLRGKNDVNGGLLTDTIMLLRYDKEKKRVALISIPRDLYVEMPGFGKKEKINFAYELGEKRGKGEGLKYAKEVVGDICGLNADYAIAVDFAAFEKVIDQLGGIDITLEKNFSEPNQWGGMIFYLPKGNNHLSGEKALYYVRSRFSTNDFDRARRQQDVLTAVKDKALTLGILSNPFRVYGIAKTLAEHVQTDFGINETIDMITIVKETRGSVPIRKVFDISKDGLLDSSYVNGSYILLPKNNDFDSLKNACQNVFEN
ncbi:hypothetical protein A2W39_00315 [Candidatus Azambacteria bacterium RIFCSPHIGHO2_01_46_10]|uniref:Cell envelope-related transcriptional attenuator domain-containing protein n=1 Tax=Candidatus Azambacteria bacterium RIFCSPHIGHO2_01_46_10 TaxID=1797293 RepID=A0A1F5BYC5_9BACT|nr:MAG: hypothetical protein A2W39_00315 [Candidatus Azambacteria bacterium RIFCSPHIGHO2_01_46_10]